jgi:hypothetical protein
VNVADVAVVARVPATAVPPDGVTVSDTDEADGNPAKVTPIVDARATPVAFAAGVVDATVTVLAVVNDEVNGDIAVPSMPDAATVTVYTVFCAKAAVGVKVAVGALTATVPGTAVPPGPFTVTATDEAFREPVNATVTGLVTATPVAAAVGVTDVTDGAPAVGVNTTSTK